MCTTFIRTRLPPTAITLLIMTIAAFGQRANLLDHRTPSYLRFSSSKLIVSEAETNVVITVIRTGDFRELAMVNYGTEDGTARAGEDYTATSGSLDIPAGAGIGTFLVRVHMDGSVEGPETIQLKLSHAGPNAVITKGTTTLTILEYDGGKSGAMPALNVRATGSGAVVISWPATYSSSCRLEKTTNPASAPWVAVNTAPEINDGYCVVTENASAERNFYRLKSP